MAYVSFDTAAPIGLLADPAPRIVELARGFSIETTPRQARTVADFADHLPMGSRVFIAFIPGEQPQAIVDLAARLVVEGMVPVPHIPARSLASIEAFQHFATALRAAGADEALLLAGGGRHAAGALSSSLELIDSGVMEALGFRQLFVAGHPGGSPDIDAVELARALERKNAFALRTGLPVAIVTQFGFDGAEMLHWAQAIGAAGNRLPIRISIAGPASLASLVKYAKLCGVGTSLAMLGKAGGRAIQLMGQACPDRLIIELACGRSGAAELIRDIHYFPFGGLERTAAWASRVAAGEIHVHRDRCSFKVCD